MRAWVRSATVLCLLNLAPSLLWARAIPPLSGPVVDEAHWFSPSEKEALARELHQLWETASIQLQVLTLKTLDGEPIEEFSVRAAAQWKLGDAKRDSGLMLVVSEQERVWRIEVGGGLEGEIPDLTAHRIGEAVLVPGLLEGKRFEAVLKTVRALAGAARGEAVPEPKHKGKKAELIRILLFFVLAILGILFRTLGGYQRTGMSGMGSGWGRGRGGHWGVGGLGGGSGWGGGGGSSWGGGGGGFSGGGASGRW